MSGKDLFVQATPEKIKITEKYFYEIELSRRTRYLITDPPQGELNITVPFDGTDHFGPKAVQDVTQFVKRHPRLQLNQARIGHLSLVNDRETDLDDLIELTDRENIIPVYINLPDGYHSKLELLKSDQELSSTTVTYDPKPSGSDPVLRRSVINEPKASPVQVNLDIGDEERIPRLQWKHQNGSYIEEKEQEVRSRTSFDSSLTFRFEILFSIPEPATFDPHDVLPELEHLQFKWPLGIDHSEIVLFHQGVQLETFYNAEKEGNRGEFQWQKIPFEHAGYQGDPQRYFYRISDFMIKIGNPSHIHALEEQPDAIEKFLQGEIKLKFPKPLSGLHCNFFDATGFLCDVPVETKTEISAKLFVAVAERFQSRTYSPVMQLHFDDVILDERRMNDLNALMESLFYDCRALINFEESKNGKESYAQLQARRLVGKEEIVILIDAVGSKAETERQKTVEGGAQFKSKVAIGHMTLKLQGRLAGDSKTLLKELNHIHFYLKERFEHVRTVR